MYVAYVDSCMSNECAIRELSKLYDFVINMEGNYGGQLRFVMQNGIIFWQNNFRMHKKQLLLQLAANLIGKSNIFFNNFCH